MNRGKGGYDHTARPHLILIKKRSLVYMQGDNQRFFEDACAAVDQRQSNLK